MAAGRLGGEVSQIEGGRLKLERLCIGYLDTLVTQGVHLVGIVGEHDEGRVNTQQPTDVRDVVVVAMVLFEAHGAVGLEGGQLIQRGLHHHAIARLADVADPTAFLHQIKDDAVSFLGDDFEGAFQLLHAVTVAAAQGFTGHARRVQPRIQHLRRIDITVGQRDDIVLVDDVLEDVSPEHPETGV